jgi:hypothetical protein
VSNDIDDIPEFCPPLCSGPVQAENDDFARIVTEKEGINHDTAGANRKASFIKDSTFITAHLKKPGIIFRAIVRHHQFMPRIFSVCPERH